MEPPSTPPAEQPAGEIQQSTSAGELQKSPPLAFYLAALTVLSASGIYGLTLWIFADLFQSVAAVTGALGSLFTVTGTVSGAYFGIKVANDTAMRSEAALERAYERADQSYQVALRALGELPAESSRRVIQGSQQEEGRHQSLES